MRKEQQVMAWLRDRLHTHVPEEVDGLFIGIYTGLTYISLQNEPYIDLDSEEGRIIEASDGWLLMKNRPREFVVFAQDSVDWVPPVGSDVRIVPYVRRNFNGKPMDRQECQVEDGRTCVRAAPPDLWRSPLPIASGELRSSSLIELIDQIERLRASDGIRRLSHVLVDAGAVLEPLKVCDASGGVGEPMSRLPSLAFRVQTQKVDGWLTIETRPDIGGYTLRLTGPDGASLREAGPVCSDVLTSVIVDWIDDGQWRLAKVELLDRHLNYA